MPKINTYSCEVERYGFQPAFLPVNYCSVFNIQCFDK